MNILFVTDLCPISDDEKGLPLTLLNFISDFKKLGHNVVLLRPNVILNVLIRKRKILPEGIYIHKGIKCINKNFLSPYFFKKDFKFLKDENFDLILAHMPSGILAANKISKLFNVPYFAAVHSSDLVVLKDIKYFFLRNSMKKAYIEAKKVLPRSYWLEKEIKKIIPKISSTAIIPSGIEKEAIVNQVKQTKEIKKIFAAGSLIKRKNFDSLIKALIDTDFELKIAGEGTEKNNLQNLIKKTKTNVELLGKKSKEEIYKLMDEADVFILPSLNETFGMVYLEALSRGGIVVCSKNSGLDGFIKDSQNGFITENDTKSIRETLFRIRNFEDIISIRQNALTLANDMERIKMAESYLKNILF